MFESKDYNQNKKNVPFLYVSCIVILSFEEVITSSALAEKDFY